MFSVVTQNGIVKNEINGKDKKVPSFYYLIMGLLRNQDIKEKCKLGILKI